MLRNYKEDEVFQCYGYEDMEQKLQAGILENPKVIYGHITRNMIEGKEVGDASINTFFRDPVERAISNYMHFERPGHIRIIKKGKNWENFEEYLESGFANNWQCKFLAKSPPQSSDDNSNDLFREAASFLESKIELCGITERFQDSVILFADRFNWKKTTYFWRNQSQNKEERNILLKKFGAELRKRNALDIELYQLALQKFDKDIKRMDYYLIKKMKQKVRMTLNRKFANPVQSILPVPFV